MLMTCGTGVPNFKLELGSSLRKCCRYWQQRERPLVPSSWQKAGTRRHLADLGLLTRPSVQSLTCRGNALLQVGFELELGLDWAGPEPCASWRCVVVVPVGTPSMLLLACACPVHALLYHFSLAWVGRSACRSPRSLGAADQRGLLFLISSCLLLFQLPCFCDSLFTKPVAITRLVETIPSPPALQSSYIPVSQRPPIICQYALRSDPGCGLHCRCAVLPWPARMRCKSCCAIGGGNSVQILSFLSIVPRG